MSKEKQIIPITYKAGILRDGSFFQGDYCTQGQWVRFFRGQPQNIGGMQNYVFKIDEIASQLPPGSTATSCIVYYDYTGAKHILVGLSLSNDDQYSLIDTTFANNNTNIFTCTKKFENPINTTTQTIVVISIINSILTQMILCLGMKNYTDINNNSPISIIAKKETGEFFDTEFPDFVLKEATGGMLYVSNRLFLYGNNGLVRWSSIAAEKSGQITSDRKPFLFFEDKYSINISTDKVIYGAEWRGGANTPTILFWTLSSVILVSNTANNQALDDIDDLTFSRKTITRDSSILSSNSVVEYDGIFYWPGTQRFFTFNGVVLPLENNLNRQTFFNNIDMNKRQRVFGVKNVARDEIWWFYPEKGKNANVGCTRAVIFNIVDNTWYDTDIERAAGYFDNTEGNMYTIGKNIVPYDDDDNSYIWQHEVGLNQVNLYKEQEDQVKAIPSFFTTPIMSYATFNQLKQPTGIDQNIGIYRIEPNVVATDKANMTVTINTYEYPMSVAVTNTYDMVQNGQVRPVIHERVQGRNISFTFRSNGIGSGYQMGTVFILAKIDDGRP